MNRIYQGRLTKLEKLKAGGKISKGEDWEQYDASDTVNDRLLGKNVIWDHHVLFQDAVNYYVVCLLALAQPGNGVFPIRENLDAPDIEGVRDERMVWRPFARRGAVRPGMGESVAKYFASGNRTSTAEACFAVALAGNCYAETDEGRRLLDAGLTQLLDKCTGAAGCKQAAPVFLPRFVKPAYLGSYGEDASTLAREAEGARLPFVLHDPATTPNAAAMKEFGPHSIALPNEKKPKFFGTEAAKKLRGMVAEWRKRQPESEADWGRLEKAIAELPAEFEMPGYAATSAKGEIKFRLFAMYFYRFVERSEFILGLLRALTRKPGPNEAIPERRATEAGAGDPIRTARGARGYVFRAFTSLPCWGGDDGTPVWIEFDFAAFEEALKALHQVEAKAEERMKLREQKQGQHDYQRGKVKKWKGEGGGENERPVVLEGDARIKQLSKLVDKDLSAEYEMSEGVSVKYGLQPRTIRGFRDLRKKWLGLLKEDEGYSVEGHERLLKALREFQKDNPNTVGSIVLFEALLKEQNWVIWREPSAEQTAAWRKEAKLQDDAEFAKDPLQALTDECELLEEIERLKGPIRFTPADPEHSRRQFYFSDVTALEKMGRLKHDRQTADVEIAALGSDQVWRRQDVRMHFTAPRLVRDQLNSPDGKESGFQQAMMEALGVRAKLRKTEKGELRDATFAECAAIALMPETAASGDRRILLNFPIKLEDDAIAAALGKAARWDTLQFGGADKESYWLRWPGTWIDEKKERKKTPPKPWWTNPEPFQFLSVDLGQRDAGAFALLEATPGTAPKPQSRKLGEADGKTWWATVRAMGMLRLPGEDAKVMLDGKWQEELSGKRGRNATDDEWREAGEICNNLELDPKKEFSAERHGYSFPEQNDRLLFALRKAQSRLARWQSWSSLDHPETSVDRRTRIIDFINEAENDPLELKPLAEKQQWPLIAGKLKEEIERLRKVIIAELPRIADRVQPLRTRKWEWVKPNPDKEFHELRQTERGSDPRKTLLAGQRGLSLKRIEQIESLRQRCQSLNRALMQKPGVPAKLGASKRGIELPDPCPDLLERLEALKEQRVNQTAHLILAQALGVRLRMHAKDEEVRKAMDTHGEYEPIPGRKPIDFIVLEDLNRYLASQGRSHSENSRLMKWCHRAILGKLKQLCEPYGLRVLETPAAYSSKFCSLTGVAGFRAVELNPDDREDYRWKKHLERLADPDRVAKLGKDELEESQNVKEVFDILKRWNGKLLEAREEARTPGRAFQPKWKTLLVPMQLGPVFVPMRGNPIQADINAAINLGLRATAAPESDHIHLRIRAKREKEAFVVRAENAREKARWGTKTPTIAMDEAGLKKLLSEAYLNVFVDLGNVANFDRAGISEIHHPLASGRGLWGTVNQLDWQRVKEINSARIAKWEREDDNIPM